MASRRRGAVAPKAGVSSLTKTRHDRPHGGDLRPHRLAARERQLAGDEIDGLDAVGALVDRRDARIAQVLRRAGLLDIAHAAMDLHAEGRDLDADIGREGLGDRREQRGALVGAFLRAGSASRCARSMASAVM